MSDKNNNFNFMLKEYEMHYGKFEMHYNAVEKTISLYFIIIAGIISANGFFLKNINDFLIFELNDFQILCCLFIALIGLITILKVIEHRILIIKYVKNLNLKRKWFIDNSGKDNLDKYSVFKANYDSPKYYKRFSHFFWEISGISIINSCFLSIFTINIFTKLNFHSNYFSIINWGWFFVLNICFFLCMITIYRQRSKKEEIKLKERMNAL